MLTKASRDGLGLLLFFVATSHVVNVGLEKMSRCAMGIRRSGSIRSWRYHRSEDGQRETAPKKDTHIIKKDTHIIKKGTHTSKQPHRSLSHDFLAQSFWRHCCSVQPSRVYNEASELLNQLWFNLPPPRYPTVATFGLGSE